ncbi:hypothetical protein N431DRAFT_55648 [Stipitochalara longipes BDJ]|nr:hypothetical protein N431DRAFT_55648 [Stipitochalara longipes BDJ]
MASESNDAAPLGTKKRKRSDDYEEYSDWLVTAPAPVPEKSKKESGNLYSLIGNSTTPSQQSFHAMNGDFFIGDIDQRHIETNIQRILHPHGQPLAQHELVAVLSQMETVVAQTLGDKYGSQFLLELSTVRMNVLMTALNSASAASVFLGLSRQPNDGVQQVQQAEQEELSYLEDIDGNNLGKGNNTGLLGEADSKTGEGSASDKNPESNKKKLPISDSDDNGGDDDGKNGGSGGLATSAKDNVANNDENSDENMDATADETEEENIADSSHVIGSIQVVLPPHLSQNKRRIVSGYCDKNGKFRFGKKPPTENDTSKISENQVTIGTTSGSTTQFTTFSADTLSWSSS